VIVQKVHDTLVTLIVFPPVKPVGEIHASDDLLPGTRGKESILFPELQLVPVDLVIGAMSDLFLCKHFSYTTLFITTC
jgi:hypothetical protein